MNRIRPAFSPRKDDVDLHPLAWKRWFTTSNRSHWVMRGSQEKTLKWLAQTSLQLV